MSNYITVPINENGVIFDPAMTGVVADAMAASPFGFEDVYVYSHGWSTDADRALDLYNQFSIELSKQILLTMAAPASPLVNPPRNSLGIGIHWPSEITEDPNSLLNDLQLFTFYTMEQRADAIGKNAVYAMLRLLLTSRGTDALPLRLFLMGHSFGCKVVCSALNDLQVDIANKTIPVPPNLSVRVVLLEPATDDDNLEPGDIYGAVSSIADLRMLITTSTLDAALCKWYLEASRVANLFHGKGPTPALGAAGPTPATVTAFGGSTALSVPLGFTAAQSAAATTPLVVADLSPAHQARVTSGAYSGGVSGSHSDINFMEVYSLVMGFIFA